MSDSNIVRNMNSASIAFTCNGSDYVLPGGGDTTMLPREVALFAERNHFHEGVQIVHADAEAAARADAQALVAELQAAVAITVGPAEPVMITPVVSDPEPEPLALKKKPRKVGKR
jgi:hypothetical protein